MCVGPEAGRRTKNVVELAQTDARIGPRRSRIYSAAYADGKAQIPMFLRDRDTVVEEIRYSGAWKQLQNCLKKPKPDETLHDAVRGNVSGQIRWHIRSAIAPTFHDLFQQPNAVSVFTIIGSSGLPSPPTRT